MDPSKRKSDHVCWSQAGLLVLLQMSGTLLPQSLCTCYPWFWGCFSWEICMAHSPHFFQVSTQMSPIHRGFPNHLIKITLLFHLEGLLYSFHNTFHWCSTHVSLFTRYLHTSHQNEASRGRGLWRPGQGWVPRPRWFWLITRAQCIVGGGF